jgi:hypothetical protein
MRMIAIAAVMALALSGCVSTAPKVQEVLVPVPVPCKVAIPDRPALAVDSLPVGSGIWEQMKALRAERNQRAATAIWQKCSHRKRRAALA